MFATIKTLIPEPRQADQPRNYVGRHRVPETVTARAAVTVIAADGPPAPETEPAIAAQPDEVDAVPAPAQLPAAG